MYHIAFRAVSPDVKDIIQKMLIKDPLKRITS